MPMKNPPHASGFVRRQCIEPLGLTITVAAAALGVTRTILSELVNEKCGISPEMAVRLSKVFGGSAETWLTQQAHYDLVQVHADRIKPKRLELTVGFSSKEKPAVTRAAGSAEVGAVCPPLRLFLGKCQ
jgi:addiction module HigA family antidote